MRFHTLQQVVCIPSVLGTVNKLESTKINKYIVHVHVHNNLQIIKLPTGWPSAQSTLRYSKVHVFTGIQSTYRPIQGLNVTTDLTDS